MEVIHPPLLLVALPQLQDPHFQKAVVLIVEHNEEGAMGFVINRPSTMPVKEIIESPEVEIPASVPAWIGGPVGADNGLVLHNAQDTAAKAIFSDDFTISSSIDALRGLVAHAEDYHLRSEEKGTATKPLHEGLYPFRFIVGYAGWGAGQLEEEVRLGAWMQLPFSEQIVFHTPWHEMWNSAIGQIGVNPMDIAPAAQPYLN